MAQTQPQSGVLQTNSARATDPRYTDPLPMTAVEFAKKFANERFKQMSFLPNGDIILCVEGCLHGWAILNLGPYCSTVAMTGYGTDDEGEQTVLGEEHWLLTPYPEHKQALMFLLTQAWRRYTNENVRPRLVWGNVHKEWVGSDRKPSSEQIKAVLILLGVGHTIRPAELQGDQGREIYGLTPLEGEDYIALEVDGRVFCVLGDGFIRQTYIKVEATDEEKAVFGTS